METGGESVLGLARKERILVNKENALHYTILLFSCVALLLLVGLLGAHYLEISGYATSISSKAGEITEITIHSKTSVDIWGGFYGLVLRVPDFTQQLSEDLNNGEIERSDIFFDCIQLDAEGGPEVYASTNDSLNLATETVLPATVEMIDNFIGCSGEIFCANNTFIKTINITLAGTNITNIPATHTYKFNGENDVFDVGALNVSGNLVFVSHINNSIQKGFNANTLVNYQMLIPTPNNTESTYYFYADPSDTCPSGGIGTNINATVWGYTRDGSGNNLSGVEVNVAGYSTTSDSNGFYNLSTLVLEGTYHLVATKANYTTNVSNVTISFSEFIVNKNLTLEEDIGDGSEDSQVIFISGYVNDSSGDALANVSISFGNETVNSSESGDYNFTTLVLLGEQPIVASKTDYDNYFDHIEIGASNTTVDYNITLESANLNVFPTGPHTEDNEDDEEGDNTEKAQEEANKLGQDFWVSTSEINKQVRENTFIEDVIGIYNFKESGFLNVGLSVSSDISDILELDKEALSIETGGTDDVIVTISGTKPIGIYRGTITLTGDIESEIPVKIEIVPRKLSIESLDMEIDLFNQNVRLGEPLKYRLNLLNLLSDQEYLVELKHLVLDSNGTTVFVEEVEEVEIDQSLTLIKELQIPEELEEGDYLISVEASYLNLFSSSTTGFAIARPLYLYSFFGVPLWMILLASSILGFLMLNFMFYRRQVLKKKRYHLYLKPETLPKPGERSIKLGRIAEKNIPAYYEMDDLTTHAIVAGATGGGKSIAAQVFIEEMLEKNIAVIVFDPTAQWSGMLRKCEDKKMLSFYPQFGLKPGDAKAFQGNVRQITNERQAVDVNKHIHPGQIQIFTLNKLTPGQIDTFVAGVIASIFKSDPKEHPELKVVLVFDEVHRLLPKFGGSGKGFLQIERACREFRKWGFGVMLVSQVLSDFVGEIKANINTEVQMRVAEENDLARIKERYGLDALKSLVRAGVGTGMVQNAEYNKGKPYFINFRPILHNTRRLSDEVLEKYNNYNDQIDDIEYQIEQLEKEKADVFDLKMELKLVKDKLMTGNFTVVDIYLEGLKPRMEKQWSALGKQPAKREMKLVDEGDVESALKAAEKERKEFEEKEKEESKKEQSEEKTEEEQPKEGSEEEKKEEDTKPQPEKEE